MQIISFLSHYQLVYISFDISSFSLISYVAKGRLLHLKRASFTSQKGTFYNAKGRLLFFDSELILHKTRSLTFHYYNNQCFILSFIQLE